MIAKREKQSKYMRQQMDGWMNCGTDKQWTITQLKKEKGYSDICYNMDERCCSSAYAGRRGNPPGGT